MSVRPDYAGSRKSSLRSAAILGRTVPWSRSDRQPAPARESEDRPPRLEPDYAALGNRRSIAESTQRRNTSSRPRQKSAGSRQQSNAAATSQGLLSRRWLPTPRRQ